PDMGGVRSRRGCPVRIQLAGTSCTRRTMTSNLLNILLVEDDEVDVMNVRRAFTTNNIVNPLYVASNGEEALEMLRSGEVPRLRRIVLLDLNMPRMNGIEFLQELRKDSE